MAETFKKAKAENNTISTFYGFINNFVHFLKFPVFFILYLFAFFYSRVSYTFPIVLLLLLILHFVFAIICFIGYKSNEVFYDDFFINFHYNHYNYQITNKDTFIFLFFKAFQFFFYIAPFVSWVFLLASIALLISLLNRLGFYNDNHDFFYFLNQPQRHFLHSIVGNLRFPYDPSLPFVFFEKSFIEYCSEPSL